MRPSAGRVGVGNRVISTVTISPAVACFASPRGTCTSIVNRRSNGTTNQPGCPTADPKGAILSANAWHCIEGFFDGTKGDFQIYVDPKSATDAPAIDRKGVAGAKRTFKRLRFGYREYHPHDRDTWYDDVATAPARIGCL